MPTELATSEEFEQYDDEKELRRLIRAVKFSQKHFLYFVCCNQVPKQNDLIADVEKNLKGEKIRVVKFKKPITDLLGELQKKTIGKDCEAVFVQGLEHSISSDATGAENALIYNLNISRDSFKKYLSCPLFLWLPEYAIVKITRHAPDFFSVRSGTFYFSNPPERVAEQILQNVSSSYLESSSLPIAEKYKQVKVLESLLAEYRGLHKETQDRRAEMRLLSKLSDFFNSISEYRKTVKCLENALHISREIGDRQGESDILANLAITFRRLGDIQRAIEFQEQSLRICREIGYRVGEAHSLGDLANVYSSLDENQKALAFYEQSLKIFREVDYQQGENACLSNLGNFYNKLNDYQTATKYYEQSLEISRKTGDRFGEGINLGNLGSAYHNLGEYRKAIEYYELAIKISREIGDRLSESANLNNLGLAYNNLGEKEKACGLWKESLAIYEAIESPNANNLRQRIDENCK